MQVPVDWLVLKADAMFPEDVGAKRAFAKEGAAAEKTNAQRIYMHIAPKEPELLAAQSWAKTNIPETVRVRTGLNKDGD